MTKIRVNKSNSKILNGKLYISLLKVVQIKNSLLKKLINAGSSITFPNGEKFIEYKGDYIRTEKVLG